MVISGRAERPFVTASLLDRHRRLQPLEGLEKGKGRKERWLFIHFHAHLFDVNKQGNSVACHRPQVSSDHRLRLFPMLLSRDKYRSGFELWWSKQPICCVYSITAPLSWIHLQSHFQWEQSTPRTVPLLCFSFLSASFHIGSWPPLISFALPFYLMVVRSIGTPRKLKAIYKACRGCQLVFIPEVVKKKEKSYGCKLQTVMIQKAGVSRKGILQAAHCKIGLKIKVWKSLSFRKTQ